MESSKGISGGSVDYVIRCSDEESRQLSSKTNDRFEVTEEWTILTVFTGSILGKNKQVDVVTHQSNDFRKLECEQNEASFTLLDQHETSMA